MSSEKKRKRVETQQSNSQSDSQSNGKERKLVWEEECPFTKHDVVNAFGEEVHMFMHVHMRGYDREGDGRAMDASYYDKYGAPVSKENAWMHGYHVIEREMAKHFNQCTDTNIMFPLVAGMAGGAHLYKPVGHDKEPWNWTGWVPRRKVWCSVNTFHKNRHFLNLRGNEIQNNLWDYHPFDEDYGADEDDALFVQLTPLDSFQNKGYWLKGNPWARYIHIISLKTHEDNAHTGQVLRYNYIVHPLAYRATIDKSPDNHVDGVQWANLNVRYDGNFEDPKKWGDNMHGLEVFNDFTYYFSWSPKTKDGKDGKKIPYTVHNGTLQNKAHNDAVRSGNVTGVIKKEYIYWHDTYPMEFGEFLLDTSFERGVYVHVLAANDAFYMMNLTPDATDYESKAKHEENMNRIHADPKGGMIEADSLPTPTDPEHYCSKTIDRLRKMKGSNQYLKEAHDFFKTRPYHSDTAFGHVALIDTEQTLRTSMDAMCLSKRPNMSTDSEKTEYEAMKMLVSGKFFAHTGVYDLFNYKGTQQVLPFVVHNQPDAKKMCYQLTENMELIFDFPKVKSNKINFIWRYSLEYEKADKTFETVHGYFKMDAFKPTRLNLSDKYDKRTIKWIQFASFFYDNPQRRAWYQGVRGLAFGEPKPKVTPARRSHRVVQTNETEIKIGSIELAEIREEKDFTPFKLQLKSEKNNLNFLFPKCSMEQESNIYVYDMQVCALLPEDNEKTKNSLRGEDGRFLLPERYVQNVHGYFVLNQWHPTKLNLNYSWDGTTLLDQTINFYCIKTSTGQPTNSFPHPSSKMSDEYKIDGDRNN